jgi:chromate transporter
VKSVYQQTYSVSQIKRFIYLKEIFFLSIGAFGGPGAHLNAIIRNLVKKRKYITEGELLELHSFCQMLPGPTSTQMITSIGYKLGGPWLAFFSLLLWVLPATLLMTAAVILWNNIDTHRFSLGFLKYIEPMAVGFIIAAALKVFMMINKNRISVFLYLVGAICGAVFRSPWIFPCLLVFGGWLSRRVNKNDYPAYTARIRPRWNIFILFAAIMIVSVVVANITKSKPLLLFGNSFQYGSIVFGGGNVLIPMMYKQYVTFRQYMSPEDFILGVGLLQALPGPVFSISTYANGMAMQDWGIMGQALGCFLGTAGIFLPGILIVFFLFPIWDEIKKMPLVRKAIEGITAVCAGLVFSAAYLLFRELSYEWVNMLVLASTLALVLFTRIPSPLVVVLTILCGFIF